ncbi:polyprenyl synthetase family protein [Actinophytocola oryzae]|uniref:Geranylgeranyl diphosphate synthase type I n=1 Tax=Actinophytocola oryzae TaxID=502181 RepID=A0A4V3FUP8_9PSEU|nr:polyprenyl synthetase family protein [Actinophytocola oryzae]TDV56111.1 geranylgeranyl diphosphate synthase type I [Actinophytocola oryzae]
MAIRASTSADGVDGWRADARAAVADEIRRFVGARSRDHLGPAPETRLLADVLGRFVEGGKYVRSAFALAGWACVSAPTPAAVRAAGSLELLHCFALLQDDVMDQSPRRRGSPTAHVVFAEWHRGQGLAGSPSRFGESAAVLAGDLFLVWAEQMLRESGVGEAALARVLPRYDRMRSDLAVGQLRDLVNDARRQPTLHDVRAVARAKSGDYTVRGPLELGAELAGASPALLGALGQYGAAVGEAFQLRDDLLGLFGTPDRTGKPVGEDLLARKATAVMVLARERADTAQRRELARLDRLPTLDRSDVDDYLALVSATGAREHAERLVEQRLRDGMTALSNVVLSDEARRRLVHLADLCGNRNE